MKEIAAIVEVDTLRQLSRDISREHIALQDIDRKVEINATQGESLRQRQAQHRLEMGRLLVEAKKQCPHGTWLPFLEKLGIPRRSASDWMDLANGHVDTSDAHSPKSQKERQADRAASNPRTRDSSSEDDDDNDEQDETKPDPKPPSLDIDRELSKLRNKFCDFAEAVPTARKQIAHELRETARLIEGMP